MAWILLVTAGLLEVVWAIALKESNGFSRAPQTVLFAVALVASMTLLAQALRTLPVGTGYAVWTGIGAIGAAVVGIVLLGESVAPARLLFLACVAVGVVGLGFTGH
jgi:quaternary ammonium compound-resistance protein SugE